MAYRIAVILFAGACLLFVGFADKRTYTGGRFMLDLDGESAGWVKSADGGHATADVIEEDVAGDALTRKHISTVKFEPFRVAAGTGMSKGMYEWVKASFDGKPARKNGSVIAADFNYKAQSRIQFSNALITEVGFPACDGASKDPAYMILKFAAESTKFSAGSGLPVGPPAAVQKKWLPSNFRLEIGDLDCSRVSKIEALSIKQKVVERLPGQIEPAKLEFPNLSIYIPETDAKGFYDWHEDFVIKGNNGQASEKGGSLTYLAPDLKEVLFTLSFSNLGIFKCSPDKSEAGSESIRRVKAEMYCEDIRFSYGQGVWALK